MPAAARPADAPAARPRRRALLAWLAAAPVGALSGCGEPAASALGRLDAGWHRADLVDNLLPRWIAHAPRPGGGFQLAFNRAWQAQPRDALDLTGQARLVYAFAAGYEVTQQRAYLDAARRGAAFVLERFADPLHGGFFHTVAPDGRPRAMVKRAYDHAFALLALAELYRVGGDARHRDAALQAWRDIERGFVEPGGGLVNECARDFTPSGGHTQNPVMHLFEALLALQAATGDAGAGAGARRLGDFVANRLMQGQADGGACIPEWYDERWRPLPTKAAGGYIDLGHQFEWAHLFTAGAAVSPIFAAVGERVLAYALTTGYDEAGGGCGLRAYPDGAPTDAGKGWWQQAECLHALLVCAAASGRNDLWRRYEQTAALIREQLVDTEQGGWRAAQALPCKTGHCRDEQPEPYHMVRLHQAALRQAGLLAAPGAPR